MRSISNIFSVVSSTALFAVLALPASAMAAELSNSSPSYGDKVLLIHNDYGKEVIIKGDLSNDELKKLRDTVSEQTRQIEELKRSSGSNSSSSSKEIDDLQNKVKDLESEAEDQRSGSGDGSAQTNRRGFEPQGEITEMVPETGIEPATFALRVRCSTG
jgi:methyl-accepting chemotaxis protein